MRLHYEQEPTLTKDLLRVDNARRFLIHRYELRWIYAGLKQLRVVMGHLNERTGVDAIRQIFATQEFFRCPLRLMKPRDGREIAVTFVSDASVRATLSFLVQRCVEDAWITLGAPFHRLLLHDTK